MLDSHLRRLKSLLSLRFLLALFGAAGLLISPARAQVAGANNIVINEMAPTTGGDHEIELYNYGSNQLMTGWTLTYDTDTGVSAPHVISTFTFPVFTLNRHAIVEIHWSAGVNTATDLYLGSATTVYTEGQVILKDNLGNGVDYVRFGTSFYNAQPADLSWWSNATYTTSTCPLYRNKDLNTRVSTDWTNPATCVAGTATAPTYGALNPNQVGSRRHGKVIINEFYIGTAATIPWIEIYNPSTSTVYMTGGKIEAYDDATGIPCFTYTLTSPNTYFLAAGAVVAIDLPAATTCVWHSSVSGGLDGQIRLVDAVGEGWDYVAFNNPTTHYIPSGVAWTGGDMDLNFLTRSFAPYRKDDLDTDNFAEWTTLSGSPPAPNSKGALNTTQAGDYPYDELGSEGSSFNNTDAAGAGWGTQVDVDAPFLLREYKVRLNISATQDIHLVVRKLVGATWTLLYDLPLASQVALNGVYSTGSLAAPIHIDAPASYLFMVYSSGPFTFYRSTTASTGRFAYGTVAGYRKDAIYPPNASPSISGATTCCEISSYFLTTAGPDITTTSLPNGEVAVPYSQTVARSGGTAPFVWAVASGTLPAGLALNTASGLISGTPTLSGTSIFSLSVTDSSGTGVSDTQSFTLSIYSALTINALTLIDAEVGFPYSRTLTRTGGLAAFVWSKVSGPAWMLVSSGGALTGTPPATGTAALTASVSDSLGGSDTYTYNTITVQPVVQITTTSLPAGAVGTAYSQALARTGGVPAFTWTLVPGTLQPNGLSLSAAGVLSGIPQVAGSFSFTARITDIYGATDTSVISLTITQPLMIRTDGLAQGVISVNYPATALAAVGGVAPYSFSLTTGPLPAGITFSAPGGTLSGTPTALGSFPLTFQVTDSTTPVPLTASRSLTLTVAVPPDKPSWQARGLFGGTIWQLAPSPSYPTDNTLFARGDQFELYRTTDRGANWSRFVMDPANANESIGQVVLSPVYNQASSASPDVQTLFLTCSSSAQSVWKSVDHGQTWGPLGGGLPAGSGSAIAISPNYASDGTVWAGVYVSASVRGIYRSLDKGATWALLADLVPLTTFGTVDNLVVSPNFAVDQTLFMSVYDKLFRSTNGGAAWTTLATTVPAATRIDDLRISPDYARDHTVMLKDGSNRLHRTRDTGASFSQLTPVGYNLAVAARPGQTPLWLFKGSSTNYGLEASDNGGDSFVPLYAGGLRVLFGGIVLNAFEASPQLAGGGTDFFTATDKGVDISFDSGFSFRSRDSGLTAAEFLSFAGSGTTLIGTGRSGWYKSADSGLTWVRIGNVFPNVVNSFVSAISPDYANDNLLFIGENNRFNRSIDGGQSFTQVSSEMVRAVAFRPGFAGASGELYIGTDSGLYKSTNGGTSFTSVTLPPACGTPGYKWILGIAYSPNYASDNTIFVGSPTLCKSVNGGSSWSALAGVPNSSRISLSPTYINSGANGTAQKTLFTGSDYDVFRSTDGGAVWTTPGGLPASGMGSPQIAVSPRYATDNTVLLSAIGASAGIYRSSNGGATFALLTTPDLLYTRDVIGIQLDPGFNGASTSNSVAVAVTDGSGVWRSDDGGRSFGPVAGYKLINGLVNMITRAPGGGAAFAGPGYIPRAPNAVSAVAPGDFLVATAGDGVFQSTDGGLTFTSLSKGLPAKANVQSVAAPSGAVGSPLSGMAAGGGMYRYNGTQWSKVTAPNVSATGSFSSFLEDGTNLYATNRTGQSAFSADDGVTWNNFDSAVADLTSMDFNASTAPTTLAEPADPRRRPPGAITTPVTASLWSVSVATGPRWSGNAGATWTSAPGTGDYLLPGGQSYSVIVVLGINAATGGRDLVAGTTTGLFRSNDGGATWRSVSGPGSGLEATSKIFSAILSTPTPNNTTDVLVGVNGTTLGGVYLSGDGGDHWTQINQGFDPNSLNITTLVKTSCSGCPVNYYTGTYGSGVYNRTIAVNLPPAITSWCFGSTSCGCGTAAASGPESGGQPFKLCGANFLPAPLVDFDGLAASGCVYVSGTVLTCTGTPIHWAGPAMVRVRNNDTRTGVMPPGYSFTGGARGSNLTVAKSGNNALLNYTCTGCGVTLPKVYRSQNNAFTLNVETYTGGATTYTNTGALAAGSNGTYFWSVE